MSLLLFSLSLSLSLGVRGAAAGFCRAEEKSPFVEVSTCSGFFFLSLSLPLSLFTLPLFFSIERNLHRLFLLSSFFFLLSSKHSHGQLRLSLRAGDCGGTYTAVDDEAPAAATRRGEVLRSFGSDDDDDGERKQSLDCCGCGGRSESARPLSVLFCRFF